MKNVLFLMLAVLAFSAAFFSSCEESREVDTGVAISSTDCSSEESTYEYQDLSSEDMMFDKFYSFNDSLVEACVLDSNFVTRGGTSWLKRICKVVCADISGARSGAYVGTLVGGAAGTSVGACVGAAFFSLLAGLNEFGPAEPSPQTFTSGAPISSNQHLVEYAYATTIRNPSLLNQVSTIELDIPVAYSTSSTQIGKTHNAILDLCNEDENAASYLQDITGVLTDAEISVIHSQTFIDKMNMVAATGDFTVRDSDETGAYVIDLFMDVVQQCATCTQDIKYIINRYSAIIESCNALTPAEKQQVYDALTVAAYSCEYWQSR